MTPMALGADGITRTLRRGGTLALLALAWAAGAATASAPPTLLATAPDDSTGFLARPGFITFNQNRPNRTPDYLAGPGLTQQGFKAGRQPSVVWTRWGSRAVGSASYWIGYHTPCHDCHYISRVVRLAAWRVVDGRYTRLSITDVVSTGKAKASTYDLANVSVPADGVAGGVPAYAWCNASDTRVCSPP
jgi:hypothetical protein